MLTHNDCVIHEFNTVYDLHVGEEGVCIIETIDENSTVQYTFEKHEYGKILIEKCE